MTKEELIKVYSPAVLLSNPEVVKKINQIAMERKMAIFNFERAMNESKEKFEALRKRLKEEYIIKKENQQ